MTFEWDERKRLLTIARRNIDFRDMVEIFALPHLLLEGRSEIENRQIAVGELDGSCFSVVFTMRRGICRIITARKARKNEREQYQALFSGRGPEDEG